MSVQLVTLIVVLKVPTRLHDAVEHQYNNRTHYTIKTDVVDITSLVQLNALIK